MQGCQKRPGGNGGWQAGHEPAMCPHSPESQPDLGLHQKKYGQQGEGGDPVPLLCAGETSPAVLHPDVEFSVRERHGSVGARPEEGLKYDQRAGAALLQGLAERCGALQPGEEKARGNLILAFQYLKGAYGKAGEGLFMRACNVRMRENGFFFAAHSLEEEDEK